MVLKPLAIFALMAAGGMSGGAVLHGSNVSFKDALASCPGALGSVSFALHHARVAAAPGIGVDESEPDANQALSLTLTDASGSKTAAVTIDQKKTAVSAKNLKVVRGGTVACILAD